MTQIAYSIEAEIGKTFDGLAISFAKLEKKGYEFKLSPIDSPFPAAALKRLATSAQDVEAIQYLIKEELYFQSQQTGKPSSIDTLSFHLIHIRAAQAIELLKCLADTQKLFFKGKQLVTDFYGKVDFYYRIETLNPQSIQVTGRLKWRDYDLDVRECDLIGPGKPHWFIRGIALKIISTDVHWKSLKTAYHTHPWILEGIEKVAFLKTLEDLDDPDQPQIVMEKGTQQELYQLPDPMPFLILQDRSGAFATLWMDYGQENRVNFQSPLKKFQDCTGKILIQRQLDVEKGWEKDLLETDFIRKDVGSSHYYCPLDKVSKCLIFLLELGWHIQDWKGRRVVKHQDVELSINPASQALLIQGKIHYDTYEADVTDVLGAFNRRERFVQLNSLTVGLIPDQWDSASLQELTQEGEIIGQTVQVKKSHFGALESLWNQSHIAPDLTPLKTYLKENTINQNVQPALIFKGNLRPYQQQGLNWLSFLYQHGFHGILADDMGLGKTVQVLAFLSSHIQNQTHLIVMPTSLLFNWKKEIEKFMPNVPLYLHHGLNRAKTVEEFSNYSLILTSYTTLRIDLPLLNQLSYTSIILDEAQAIKNAYTQTSQAVRSLHAQFRLSITGTPIENHLGEIWSHFCFLMPGLFGDEKTFQAELQAAESDNRYLQRIKKKMAPFILRRKKEEVAKDLPERIDQTIWIEMGDDQRRYYDQFVASLKAGLLKKVQLEGLQAHRLEIFEAILRLRQICCHPLLTSSLQMAEPTSPMTSAKFDTVLQDLETALEEKRKVLIYSQFTSMLHLLTQEARIRGWNYAYLDGQTKDREKVVTSFQEDPAVSLFFISLKAGGVGLNLTAADDVFLYDPWWNEAVEEQAINRAHRIGRTRTVMARRFVVVESIEEKIMKLKTAKRVWIDEVLEKENFTQNFSLEDLSYLLS